MPNFIAKKINEINLPYEKSGVKFERYLKGRKSDFLVAKVGDERFLVAIRSKGENFVIKGEKLTKPSKIGLLHKALEVLKSESEVVNSTTAVKKTALLKNSEIILNFKDALKRVNSSKKVAIEIGFGSGRHLLFRSKNEEDKLFLGIEIYKPSIEQVAKLALKDGLENLILLNGDARVFLELINSNLVDEIYLHFPVPWEKAEHRRVISSEFLAEVKRALKSGGKFELRSDSREYVEFSVLKFLDLNSVKIEILKNSDIEISSKYEDRWKKQDKDIFTLSFVNSEISPNLEIKADFSFKKLDPNLVLKEFKNETFKFEDYFIHFEEIYRFKGEDAVLLKLSFGDFNASGNYFIEISNLSTSYFINEPLPTIKNQKAHKKIGELLRKCQIS